MSQRPARAARQHENFDTATVVPLVAGATRAATREAGAPRSRGTRAPAPDLGRRGASSAPSAAAFDAAREEIQRHVARELHDGLGAELTAARFALANVEHALLAQADPAAAATALALAQSALDAACEAGRRLIEDLHEPKVEGGLGAVLAEWTESFSQRTGLPTRFVCAADVRLAHLPPEASLAILRVAQEALNNVAKHADASHADVCIRSDDKRLVLVVQDDGRGMPPRARRPGAPDSAGARGFGLPGMRARCEAYGGALRIASRLRDDAQSPWHSAWPADVHACGGHSGTTVRAHFPWAAIMPDLDRAPRSRLHRLSPSREYDDI